MSKVFDYCEEHAAEMTPAQRYMAAHQDNRGNLVGVGRAVGVQEEWPAVWRNGQPYVIDKCGYEHSAVIRSVHGPV